MCQFVQQESDKKQESGNDGRRPHRSATPLRRDGAEATDQGQGNEEGDNKPAIVQPDRDTSDSAKSYLCVHTCWTTSESRRTNKTWPNRWYLDRAAL